jgi:hypothetical protein
LAYILIIIGSDGRKDINIMSEVRTEGKESSEGLNVKLSLSHMELELCSDGSFQLFYKHFTRNVCC